MSDDPGGRIPDACILGVTNDRFQWVPGPFDVLEHYAYKWHVGTWLLTKAVPFLEKWLPVLIKWEQTYQKVHNSVILATPIVLKILHKW